MKMFQSLVSKQTMKASDDNTNRVLIKAFEHVLILRIGNRDKAEKFIHLYTVDGVLNEYGFLRMILELKLDKLFLIIKPIILAENYIKLFTGITNLEKNAKKQIDKLNAEEKKSLYEFLKRAEEDKELKQLVYKLVGIKGTGNIAKWFLEMNVTSKSKIADELNIDKKTLNKWLVHFYGNKYFKARKISMKDYFNIMLKLSLSEEESKKEIGSNISEYAKRLETDLVHNRKSILHDETLGELNYRSLKENLNLQQLDGDMKKLPYSIKEDYKKKLT